MIRIDEIYDNVFSPKILSTPLQSMHYFDPFGRTDVDALRVKPLVAERNMAFLFWDQEPYYPDIHKETIDFFHKEFIQPVRDKKFREYEGQLIPKKISNATFVTSEKNSKNVNEMCEQYGYNLSYYFFHGWASLDWFRGYNRTYLIPNFKDRNITNTFTCPNRVISGKRSHRINLLKQLVKHDIVNDNNISFPSKCPYDDGTVVAVEGVKLPLVFKNESADNIPNESFKISFWDTIKESLIYVVTETLYEQETLHLTEKTFKPIVMQIPFLLVAPKHSLDYLRSYGFKTFNDFWSEDYDHQDNDIRIKSIASILKGLDDMSVKEKQQLQKHLVPVVEHNYNWFYSNEFEQSLWSELNGMIKRWN
jgi:hypothetical protein